MNYIRIAVDARMIRNSGIGTVLANVLGAWIDKQENFFFYLLGDPEILTCYNWSSSSSVMVVPCLAPIYSIREQMAVPFCIPNDADILWVPHYNIPLFYGGKMLVTVHDVFHLDMPQLVPGLHRRMYARLMFKAVTHKADRIVCVSEFTRKRLQYFEPQLPPEKLIVAVNGIDPFWSQSHAAQERPYGKPYMLFVGNIKPNKNLKRLMKAFCMVKEQIPHDLIIVGKKEGFIIGDREVMEAASAMGERVFFTGRIDDDALRNYYRFADLFVFPSLYEGFGLPPMEALAAGCHRLLLSDIPVLREIYHDLATFADPYSAEALAEGMLSCPKKPPVSAKQVDSLMQRHNWQQVVQKMESMVTQVVSDTSL